MRKLIALATFATAAACSTSPQSYVVTTPQPVDAAFGCATRQINQMGYTISNTNSAGGLIVAERQSSGLATRFLTGTTSRDQLTVSIFDGATPGTRQIRVTAAETSEHTNLITTGHQGASKPSDKAVADANALLLACGAGPVSRQSSTVYGVLARFPGE
jgi:hypothetical protein